MSDDIKRTAETFQEHPFNPFLGLDIGERWGRELGSIDSRLIRIENDGLKLDSKVDVVEARLISKIDSVEVRLNDKIDVVEARLNDKIDALDAKLDAVEAKLNDKIDALEAKLSDKIEAVDKRVDKLLNAVIRLDERINALEDSRKSDRALMIGMWATVAAGIILQFFLK